jgi:putative lipoprotein
VLVERFLGVHPGERCAFTHATAPLEQTHWRLVELHGRPVQALRDRPEPYLRLLKDRDGRRAEGFAGCNQFSAGYEVTGDRLRFTRLVTTRRACRDRMDEERDFLRVLESAPHYEVSGESLTLSLGGAALARFESVSFR